MSKMAKLSSDIGLINIQENKTFRKGNRKIHQKRFPNHYCLDGHLGIEDGDFALFEQCETQKRGIKRE